jgi:diguanylate cyclase (GGDEF)-like protein
MTGSSADSSSRPESAQPTDGEAAVLLVDDDPHILSSLARILRRDFPLLTAPSGEAALALLAAHRVAVLVVDMSMPRMNGLQLIEAMRPDHPDVVPIMLTGNSDQATATDAINRGRVFRFLSKPCEADKIKSAITDARLQHRLHVAQRELNHKTELLEAAFAAMHDGVCIVDAQRCVMTANDRASAMLGPSLTTAETSLAHLLPEDDAATREIAINDRLLQVSVAGLSGGNCLIVLHDVTTIRQLEQQLRQDATTDPLTQLANRRRFMEVATAEQERARRHGRPVSLAMIDVDYFKRVNDQHGHAAGDDVLRRVAAVLSAGLRTTDMVARFGGEEFVVILAETERDGAAIAAERLRAAVEATRIETAASELAVTVSIGIATAVGTDVDIEPLIAAADAALYRAKHNGRNRCEPAPCIQVASPATEEHP